MSIRIGTRKSPLALAQAEMVRAALIASDPALNEENVTLVPMVTSGDTGAASDAGQWGLKGLFTKELEEALLSGHADIAVHSMKDVPSILPEGLVIAAMLEREDPRDAFISTRHGSFASLPHGAVVGTSSTRRAAQLKQLRHDLTIVPLRGNVGTRLAKLDAQGIDATLLAMAGLNRLGLSSHVTEALPTEKMLPAVAQGAIGIECRERDEALREQLKRINHAVTALCVQCERSLLLALDGSCRSPIAAHAVLDGHYISLHGQVLAADGSAMESGHIMAPLGDGEHIGHALGLSLKHQAARFLS